jgi:uncharacterized protein
MSRKVFINLPVKDLPRAKEFFTALGFGFNAQFTNDQGACMVVTESIYVMLLREDFFRTFTHKQITDTSASTEVLVCLSCDSRAEVDQLVAKAVAAGGSAPRPVQDHGFMYAHGFEDPDGHTWELVWMDMAATPPQV